MCGVLCCTESYLDIQAQDVDLDVSYAIVLSNPPPTCTLRIIRDVDMGMHTFRWPSARIFLMGTGTGRYSVIGTNVQTATVSTRRASTPLNNSNGRSHGVSGRLELQISTGNNTWGDRITFRPSGNIRSVRGFIGDTNLLDRNGRVRPAGTYTATMTLTATCS